METTGVGQAPAPRRAWLGKTLRIIGFAVFVVLGSVAARGRPGNGVYYDGTGEIISALIIGAIIAFVYLAVVGTIGYWISERRNGNRSWRAVTFGWRAIVVALVLLNGSAAARAITHEEAVRNATPNPSGSATERERAHEDAYAWGQEVTGMENQLRGWVKEHRALIAGVTKQGNTSAIRAGATRAQAHLFKAQQAVNNISDYPEADLNAMRDKFNEILSLEIRAYALYVNALDQNARSGIALSEDKQSLALLDRGDVLVNRAQKMSQRERPKLAALYAKYGI